MKYPDRNRIDPNGGNSHLRSMLLAIRIENWVFYMDSRIFPCLLVLGILPVWLQGQQPDFAMDQLYTLSTGRSFSSEPKIAASSQVYCDGEYIHVVVEVRDRYVVNHPESQFADHVELWLALPPEAYPVGFEYDFHPMYVASSTEPSPRFFSVYSEYTPRVDRVNFLQKSDYPTAAHIQEDSLWVPPPEMLRTEPIHFGVVKYGLFPDNRAPVLLNRQQNALWEKASGIQLGNIEQGIQYTARRLIDRYIIHARISPMALGYVRLPQMNSIRIMVDVVDTGPHRGQAYPRLTTSPRRQEGMPASFNHVLFHRALRTNFTTIPDALLKAADIHPLLLFSRNNWISTAIATDALIFREQQVSQKLMEVKFLPRPIRHQVLEAKGIRADKLIIDNYYVNARPVRTEYLLVEGRLFKTDQTLAPSGPLLGAENHIFAFPDGSTGVVLSERNALEPQGWSSGGYYTDESVSIYQLTSNDRKELLRFYQHNGPGAYCQIGEMKYDDFFVTGMDWIRPGRVLVLRLAHRMANDRKRIKVTWDRYSEDRRIYEVR